MEQYRGYWISGKAGLVHPFSPESYPAGQIYKPAAAGSIEEVTRFALQSFKMTDQDLAAFFALELASGSSWRG
jgi:hypothetical protein